jgi:uncharacterized cupin superfamily protein
VREQPELPDGFRHRRTRVSLELGAEQLGCSVYELGPGERAWPYHFHWNNEEWLIVVEGTPTLRTPEGERVLQVGDVVAFAEGETGAHDVSNRTDAPVRVAIFATRKHGDVVYPDSQKLGAGPPHDRRYFPLGQAVDYWEDEA